MMVLAEFDFCLSLLLDEIILPLIINLVFLSLVDSDGVQASRLANDQAVDPDPEDPGPGPRSLGLLGLLDRWDLSNPM